jgi:hypothetical protein
VLTADRLIAAAVMAASVYFMWHATVLPIGWNGLIGGPGGGSFPFWLSAIIFLCAAGILFHNLAGKSEYPGTFFDSDTLQSVASVIVTIAVMQWK